MFGERWMFVCVNLSMNLQRNQEEAPPPPPLIFSSVSPPLVVRLSE